MRWRLDPGARADLAQVVRTIRRALVGPTEVPWTPPAWLLAHQIPAAQRLAAKLSFFRGALLADAPGLGKTHVGLAVATRYRQAIALVPASLVAQWRSIAAARGMELTILSHEALSRGANIPAADLLVVDEAHRFRNPATRRYDVLARGAAWSHILLLTATPVVNRAADLVHLLRLFLADHGLAAFGVPSIERSLAARAYGELAHACAALVVARTADLSRDLARALPVMSDMAACAAPPAPPPLLHRLIATIEALRFPSFDTVEATALLRLHLYLRLASSVAALVATVRRHRRYLDHAIAAARRGEPVSRHQAWLIMGREDCAQLGLPDLLAGDHAPPLETSRLDAERIRVQSLLDYCLAPRAPQDPKAEALEAMLVAKGGKAIVFTNAVATARHLASRLGWRRLGLASGQGARIATGPVTLDEVLALFAPESQGTRAPPASLQVDTLIATDLVSEGLNLQDANCVIHYDLPWSPLRLEQRVGRVARLGSHHTTVRVAWFLPPQELEDRLAFAPRIARKVREQLELGAAASSRVGRAHVRGGLFEWRERPDAGGDPAATPHFTVVRSSPAAVLAIRWTFDTTDVRAVIVMEGDPPTVVRDERRAASVFQRLIDSAIIEAVPPVATVSLLQHEIRARLAALEAGPGDQATRRLAGRIVRRARAAGRARNQPLIVVLDLALQHLIDGLAVGGTRTLARYLEKTHLRPALQEWLNRLPQAARPCPQVTLDAALFGLSGVAR